MSKSKKSKSDEVSSEEVIQNYLILLLVYFWYCVSFNTKMFNGDLKIYE